MSHFLHSSRAKGTVGTGAIIVAVAAVIATKPVPRKAPASQTSGQPAAVAAALTPEQQATAVRDRREKELRRRLAADPHGQAIERALAQAGPNATGNAATLLAEWAEVNLAMAKAWVERYQPGREKLVFAETLLEKQQDQPAEAARWFAQFASEPASILGLTRSFQAWAAQDRKAALDWLFGIAQADGASQAMRQVFELWAHEDPTAASEYLTKVAQGGPRDQAVLGLINAIAREDKEAAMLWAKSISDTATRHRQVAVLNNPH